MTTTTFLGAKGGSGATVTATAYALTLGKHSTANANVLLIDATGTGDCAAVLGLGRTPDPHVLTEVAPGLDSVRCAPAELVECLAAFNIDRESVVVDAGLLGLGLGLAPVPGRGLLVVNGCYLGLRRVTSAPTDLNRAGVVGLVMVEQPGRAIGAREVADVLGLPVVARIPVRESIARAVDAGVLAHRLPDVLALPVAKLDRVLADR